MGTSALAIPVFVRSRDDKGKEFLEFATALNIGGGGALIALRRALPQSARVLLEIPSAPLAASASYQNHRVHFGRVPLASTMRTDTTCWD